MWNKIGYIEYTLWENYIFLYKFRSLNEFEIERGTFEKLS